MAQWQPIKPLIFGFERIQTGSQGVGSRVSIPQQIKCSECLIIPELLPKDSRMRIIVEYLEDNFLDCGYFDSCIKEGAFGQGETMYKDNPDNKLDDTNPDKQSLKDSLKQDKDFERLTADELRESLRGNPTNPAHKYMVPYLHTMDYKYYVEQNKVPEHVYNSRSIGTQMRKIFFDGLNDSSDYTVYTGNKNNEVTINGKKHKLSKTNLVKFYSSLHCANVIAQFESLMKIIESDASLSAELQRLALRTNNNSMTKILMYAVHKVTIDDKKITEFNTPLFENSMEHDAAATLISILRKASTQLKMDGGSLVQASAFGISTIEYTKDENTGKNIVKEDDLAFKCDKANNIIEAEAIVPFKQEYTDKNGRKVRLKFEDYCDKDGNMIMVPVKRINKKTC